MHQSKNKEKTTKKIEPQSWLASLFVKIKKLDELWIAVIALAVVGVIAVGAFFSAIPEPVVEAIEEIVADEPNRHPLTGEIIEEAYGALPQVFGVMVENSADAWPLTGLDQAFLVIEAPVEAGIPRFLAFFSEEDEVEKIGPIRSARPYYVDWADSLQVVYAHVGGSPEALEQIINGDTLDVNQFWFGDYFWRDTVTRYAPHNVYTSIEGLINATNRLELIPLDYDLWDFDEMEVASELVTEIDIDFADGGLYDLIWTYGEEEGSYLRDQGTTGWLEDGAEVMADNVVVMAMNIRTIDNIGRKAIVTVGSGDALVFRMGHADLVQWTREEDGRIVLESDGEELTMQPGITWIEIVDELSQVNYE